MGSHRVSFQDGFYGVTSNAGLHTPPISLCSLAPSVRPSVPPYLFSLFSMAKWTVIGYSFRRLISALDAPPCPMPPTGRGPFAAP